MSLNYFTHVNTVSANATALLEVSQVGYSINDNPVTEKLGGKFNKCATTGDRTREMTVNSYNLINLWTAFIKAGYGACAFTLTGEKCTDGTTETSAFSLGNGTGSSFSISVDDKSLVEGQATFALVGDPA
jgi:hypothetical protein